MNEAARQLGRLGAGKKKTMSKAAILQRVQAAKASAKARRGKPSKLRINDGLSNKARWRSRNKAGYAAQTAVYIAINNGSLKPEPCFCGEKAEAHHEDYSKPLEVTWLCRKHHLELHQKKQCLAKTAPVTTDGPK